MNTSPRFRAGIGSGSDGYHATVLAQVSGGMLLSRHVPFGEVFIAPAASLLIAAIAASALGVLCYCHLGGYRLGEATAADSVIVRSEDDDLLLKGPKPYP